MSKSNYSPTSKMRQRLKNKQDQTRRWALGYSVIFNGQLTGGWREGPTIEQIKEKLEEGLNQSQIAKIFRCSKECISRKVIKAENVNLIKDTERTENYNLCCQKCGHSFTVKTSLEENILKEIKCPECNHNFQNWEDDGSELHPRYLENNLSHY